LVLLDTKKPLGTWALDAAYIKINEIEYLRSSRFIETKLSSKVINTLGPKGANFRGRNFPVPSAEVRDVSGAGDTFMAGLTSALLQTGSIERAIEFANHCSVLAVQKRGVVTVDRQTDEFKSFSD
jgi:ribokinase